MKNSSDYANLLLKVKLQDKDGDNEDFSIDNYIDLTSKKTS
jgi:hypothetical protein